MDEDRTEASQELVRAFDGIENAELREGTRDEELAALEDGDGERWSSSPRGSRPGLGQGGAGSLGGRWVAIPLAVVTALTGRLGGAIVPA